MENEIVLYQPNDAIHLEVMMANESVWLTQSQIASLFGVDKSGISRHLKNIFESEELDEALVVAKFATTTQHGAIEGKTQTTESKFYNLDAILSVGYRLNQIPHKFSLFQRSSPSFFVSSAICFASFISFTNSSDVGR